MNKYVRRLGIFLIMCYLALFVQLNVVQVIQADDLNNNPFNSRVVQRQFNRPRGAITTSDNVLLAQSIETPDEDFKRRRVYPEGDLFAQTTGYFSFIFGSSGVEKQYNDELSGDTIQQQLNGFTKLFSNQTTVGNVQVTLRKDVQTVARNALGNREGSVVALDPRTGEILAFWSTPSYDPNLLSSADIKATRAAWTALNADPAKPMLAKQYQERYFPGSTFKAVTAGVGLQTGKVTNTEPVYPAASAYQPSDPKSGKPIGKPIANFGGEVCGGALPEVLKFSCNSAFAEMGQKTIGADDMVNGAHDVGFNDTPPIDLPAAAASVFPDAAAKDPAALAQASIGQNDVVATPLQMALVAAGVANHGTIMKPHVMRQITDSDGKVVKTYEPDAWLEPMDAEHAQTLYEDMVGVVTGGTGIPAAVGNGYVTAGKTGTAQVGDGQHTHTWMIAMAGPPNQDPTVAVAVVVLNQGIGGDSTGGVIAGPIAKQVMQATLAAQAAQPVTNAPAAGPSSTTPSGPATPAGPTTSAPAVTTTRKPDTPTTPAPTSTIPVTTVTVPPTTSGPTTTVKPTTTSGAPPTTS